MKDNLRKIKEKQLQIREQKDKENKPKELFKMKKFKDVEATLKLTPVVRLLFDLTSKHYEEDDADPYSAIEQFIEKKEQVLKEKNILQAHAKENVHVKKQQQIREKIAVEPKTVIKPSVPKKDEVNQLAPRVQKNFLSNNANAVINRPPSQQSPSPKPAEIKHEDYGKVPEYILEMKKRKMEEEAQRQKEAEKQQYPAGLKLLPEEDRLEALEILQKSLFTLRSYSDKNDIQQELMKLPIICDSIGLKKRKSELEAKLAEIEDAIRTFSRKKVFVADDSN